MTIISGLAFSLLYVFHVGKGEITRASAYTSQPACRGLNWWSAWFGLITTPAIRRGRFDSIGHHERLMLSRSLERHVGPFHWIKTAQIKHSIRNAKPFIVLNICHSQQIL